MSTQDFTYWLQGFFEIQNPRSLDETQTQIIKDHLSLVFKKETPNYTFGDLVPLKLNVWNDQTNNWKQTSMSDFRSTGMSVDFSTALKDYSDGNLSKHGLVGYVSGPNGGQIATHNFKGFLETTNSGQSVPPLPSPFGPNQYTTC